MSKSHRPTADSRLLVRELAAMGTNVEDVARLTRIAPNTLRKYYSGEMDIGRANANLKVAQAMFKAATREERPNVVAMMFWLKNRAGWKDIGAPPPGGAGVRLLEVVFVRPGHDALDVTAKPNGAGTFAVAFDGG